MCRFKFILLALFLGSLATTSIAQDFKGKKATLHNYTFALTDEFQLYLELLDEDDLDLIAPDKDPVQELFMNKSYERVKAGIESKTGLDILPKETLEGKILYDIYGYPSGHRKRAAKSGSSPYYLKLDVQMTARDIIDEQIRVNNSGYDNRKIKPHISIVATLFDDRGKMVKKAVGKAKGDRWITLEQVALFGFISIEEKTVVEEQATLLSVLDEAIEDLKSKL